MLYVALGKPPPTLFWPSPSCPTVPDCPPDAVKLKLHPALRTEAAEAPRLKARVARVYFIVDEMNRELAKADDGGD